MPLPAASDNAASLMLVEGGLTTISIAVAFAWPRLGFTWFQRIEHAFGRLARRQRLAVLSVGLAALLLRLVILPLFPIPLPFIHDDFSHLLAADTFAHGRLTNPTPAMWTHFETIHVDHEAHLHVHVLSWGGTGACCRQGAVRKSLVRHPDLQRAHVRGSLLDAAGLVAAHVGASGGHPGSVAPGSLQLLDQYLYRRRRDYRFGRSPGAGRAATPDEDGARSLWNA